MSRRVRNEKVKLLSDFFNRAAVNALAIGVLAPLAGLMFQNTALHIDFQVIVFGGLIFFASSVLLHLIARRILDGLEDDNK